MQVPDHERSAHLDLIGVRREINKPGKILKKILLGRKDEAGLRRLRLGVRRRHAFGELNEKRPVEPERNRIEGMFGRSIERAVGARERRPRKEPFARVINDFPVADERALRPGKYERAGELPAGAGERHLALVPVREEAGDARLMRSSLRIKCLERLKHVGNLMINVGHGSWMSSWKDSSNECPAGASCQEE